MENAMDVINKLMVEVFNDILKVEEKVMRSSGDFPDITVTEVHTIEAIGATKKQSMGDISKKLVITVGTLTVAVKNLEKKGYVNRIKDTEDKRVVFVDLTSKGRLLYRLHRRFHEKVAEESLVGLSDIEVVALSKALTKLHVFLVDGYLKST